VDLLGGFVDEYAQCRQHDREAIPSRRRPSAAVDKSGDLFVSYGGAASKSSKAGRPRDAARRQRWRVRAGLVIDKKGNLIADDQAGDILVIARRTPAPRCS